MSLVRALEHATLNALPARHLHFDGPFVARAFLGGTGRANAACSLDPAPDPGLAERVERIAAMYRRLGLTPRFRSSPLDPPGLAAHLAANSWQASAPSLVMAGPLSGMARPDPGVEFRTAPDAAWLEVIGTAEHQSPARQAEKQQAVPLFTIPAAWLLLHVDGGAAAAMATTCDGAFCGIFDLVVRPEFRRRGLARRMIGAAAAWAMAQGAGLAFAQVAADNTASRAVQAGLGMTERYRYRYFLPA